MQKRAGRVAVVDDDESVRSSLYRLLKSAGFAVELYASAEEFIDRGAIDRARCVIIDVQMSKMHGLELQAFCAARRASIPIIMMTAFRDSVTETNARRAGAIAFLYKPFDAGALIDAVTRATAD